MLNKIKGWRDPGALNPAAIGKSDLGKDREFRGGLGYLVNSRLASDARDPPPRPPPPCGRREFFNAGVVTRL